MQASSGSFSDGGINARADFPLIRLLDGASIPQLGFGVWQVPNDEAVPSVAEAIRAGYRLIDTAQGYGNEEGVGRGIRQSGLARQDLYITTKLSTRNLGFAEARQGCRTSLQKLGLAYLDLLLIHWPAPALDRYVDTWKSMIELRDEGLVRSIGVSNFLPAYIDRLIDETGVAPVINQIELHPQYQQRDVRDYHRERDINFEAYSPLGSGAVLDNPVIAGMARELGKSPAQIILRWHMQQGLIAIPKSVTPGRIRENLDIFDFALTPEHMSRIAALDDPANGKTGSHPETFNDLF